MTGRKALKEIQGMEERLVRVEKRSAYAINALSKVRDRPARKDQSNIRVNPEKRLTEGFRTAAELKGG